MSQLAGDVLAIRAPLAALAGGLAAWGSGRAYGPSGHGVALRAGWLLAGGVAALSLSRRTRVPSARWLLVAWVAGVALPWRFLSKHFP